jgi:hypothetical protein
MGRAYLQDLRERVMAAVDAGTGAYAALGRRQTSNQSNKRMPSPKQNCERPLLEPSTLSSKPSLRRWMNSNPKNAQIIAQIQAIAANRENALVW